MTPSRFLFALLLLAGTMLSACDDEKSTTSVQVPPDLKLSDVVGCWYFVGGYCQVRCFDSSFQNIFLTYNAASNWQYETLGKFTLESFWIVDKFVGSSTNAPSNKDSLSGKTPYKLQGSSLYVLDQEYQLATRYERVNLDSTFPCGKPFLLFPKPANWTLF